MNFDIPSMGMDFYLASLPILLVIAGSLIVMLQSVIKPLEAPTPVFIMTLLTVIAALVSCVMQHSNIGARYLGGTFISENLGSWGMLMILAIAAVLLVMMRRSIWDRHFFRGEIASLFLMILSGMMVVVTSDDLITMFVGLELSSIGVYAVVGYMLPTRRSQEGAIKYFVLGSFAAGFLLFGFALLFGATGTTKIAEIMSYLPRMRDNTWVQIGALFSLVGLGFKFALAPFHLWAPDAYEGAPTPITAFMATTVKVVVLLFTLRLFATGAAVGVYQVWTGGMLFMAILSMIFGNILALVQTSLKRMLAYSSIAHSGYMAVALAAISSKGASLPLGSVLFYVLSYSIVSLGAFGILMWLESEKNDNLQLDDLAGLAKKHPWAAVGLTVFMFSFSGMPPTVGFISKFFVFSAAIQANLVGLVIIGVIGSSISLYYYLRVVVRMFMNEPLPSAVIGAHRTSWPIATVATLAIVATILLGTLFSAPVFEWVQLGSQHLVAH